MSVKTTTVTNGVSMGGEFTLTSTDVSDGYVTVDFSVPYTVATIMQLRDSLGYSKEIDGCKISHPDTGQVKIEANVSGVAEVSTVQAVADVSQSLSGTYFTINSPSASFYVWMSMTETAATAGYQELGLTGKDGATATGLSTTTQYYVKANVDGGGVVEYDITTAGDVTWTAVLALLNTATSGVATWSIEGGDIRLTSDTTGASSSVAITAGTTGTDLLATLTDFSSVDTAVAGAAAVTSTDPAPGGTGIQVSISEDDTADTVASAIQTAVDANANFGATVLTDTVTITNATVGEATDATAGDSGFTVTVTTQGVATGTTFEAGDILTVVAQRSYTG